jgi:hypothetical protein
MAWAGDLGGGSPGTLVGGALGIAALAGGAAWLTARWRARAGLQAPAAEPEG